MAVSSGENKTAAAPTIVPTSRFGSYRNQYFSAIPLSVFGSAPFNWFQGPFPARSRHSAAENRCPLSPLIPTFRQFALKVRSWPEGDDYPGMRFCQAEKGLDWLSNGRCRPKVDAKCSRPRVRGMIQAQSIHQVFQVWRILAPLPHQYP